jgi:pyruvate,water dikinase
LEAYVIPFEQLTMRDLETVGGKNASLGEMIGALAGLGVQVPGGFATTAHAYHEFLEHGGLQARTLAGRPDGGGERAAQAHERGR